MIEPDLGLLRIHHIGIAVEDLDLALAEHHAAHAGDVIVRKELPEHGVSAAALRVGNTEIELLAPLGESPSLRRFLTRHGAGVHHVAWSVDDIDASMAAARVAGLRLIDEKPRVGLHGSLVAFLHPSGMNGVLTELVHDNKGAHHGQ